MKADEMWLVTDAVYSPETEVTGYCVYVEYRIGNGPWQKMITSSTFREKTSNQPEAEARAMLKGLNKINTMTGVTEIGTLTIFCDSPEVILEVRAPGSVDKNPYLEGPAEKIRERIQDIEANFNRPKIAFKTVPNRTGSFEYECLLHSKCSENAFNKAIQPQVEEPVRPAARGRGRY